MISVWNEEYTSARGPQEIDINPRQSTPMNLRNLLQALKTKSNVTLIACESDGRRLSASEMATAADRDEHVCTFVVFKSDTCPSVSQTQVCYYCDSQVTGYCFKYVYNEEYLICKSCWKDVLDKSTWKGVTNASAPIALNDSDVIECFYCDDPIRGKRYECRYNNNHSICSDCWEAADPSIWRRVLPQVKFQE